MAALLANYTPERIAQQRLLLNDPNWLPTDNANPLDQAFNLPGGPNPVATTTQGTDPGLMPLTLPFGLTPKKVVIGVVILWLLRR